MERRDVEAWVERYVEAWRKQGNALLTNLFTDDETYEP